MSMIPALSAPTVSTSPPPPPGGWISAISSKASAPSAGEMPPSSRGGTSAMWTRSSRPMPACPATPTARSLATPRRIFPNSSNSAVAISSSAPATTSTPGSTTSSAAAAPSVRAGKSSPMRPAPSLTAPRRSPPALRVSLPRCFSVRAASMSVRMAASC